MASAFAVGMVAVERTLTFTLPGNTATYVDVSAMLGRANQRLYRQGMIYTMSVSYQGNWPVGAPGQVELSHLPNNWAIRKAHQLAKKMWLQSTADERANGAKAGRWNDFRVFMDNTHDATNNLNTPFGSAGLGTGEILFTTAHDTAASSGARQFQFLGASSLTRWGMLEEYDSSMDTDVDTPSASAGQMPYNTLIAELDSQQADQIQEEGDNPPYDPVVLQNNIVLPSYIIGHPTTSNRSSTPQMQVPAGLLGFVNRGDAQLLNITLKAGSYKGVHAEVL